MKARVNLRNTLRPWRSQSGSILFGDNEEYYFSWLPAVPEGIAVADIEYPGGELHLEGSGYHDHNWGNISMFKLMHHWYWGRARIGDYKVIASWITAEKQYGYNEFDIFMPVDFSYPGRRAVHISLKSVGWERGVIVVYDLRAVVALSYHGAPFLSQLKIAIIFHMLYSFEKGLRYCYEL